MTLPVYQKIEMSFGFSRGFFQRIHALLTETRELIHEIRDEEHAILWKW